MTATPTAEPMAPLSAALRDRTAAAHTGAESTAFFAALAVGQVTRAQVGALAARLLPVYEALESAAQLWAQDPIVGPLVVPGLERADRLRADAAALGASAAPASSAAARYADRIAQLAPVSRPAFVAHHYTRYLGDLSGGQVIRAALQRHLGLDATNGASFYVFDALRPGQAKQSYRAALDAMPLTAAEREALIAESLVAYRLNTAVAAELDDQEIPA